MDHLDRRELLAFSAAALTGSAATAAPRLRPDAAGLAQERGGPGFRKAVGIGMIGVPGSLTDKFKALKRAGFDGVELDSPSDLKPDDVQRALEASGLGISGVVDSVHWNKPLSDPDPAVRAEGLRGLEQALRDCKVYGGTSVLLVPAVVTKQVSYWDAWWRSQAEVRKLLPLAAELQITIAIETVWNRFLLGPTEVARYVDELCSPWAGVHLDCGNLVTFGFPEHWVPILGKRIKKLHVKDFKRGLAGYKGFDVKLNEGDADWPTIVKALRTAGYDGWFTAEVHGGDEAYLTDLGHRMDSFLQEQGK
jgi:L-ribulose-5-phosphate 3-epimerase